MTVYQFPNTVTTQQYASAEDAFFAWTEWMIATGVYTEVKSSDGTTAGGPGNVASAADYANLGAYRILRSTDNREIALQHDASNTLNWILMTALSPGFNTGGSPTVLPTAADEQVLWGLNRTSGLNPIWSIGAQYWRFIVEDGLEDGSTMWNLYSSQSNGTPRLMWSRMPAKVYDPDQSAPDNAAYFIRNTSAAETIYWKDFDGTWRDGGTERYMFSASPGAMAGNRHYFSPFIIEQGAPVYLVGPFEHTKRINTNGASEQFFQTSKGWWQSYNSRLFYMGETEPSLPSVSLAPGQGYDMDPFVVPTPPPEAIPPVVNYVTSPASDLNPSDSIVLDVTDNSGTFARIFVYVQYSKTGDTEVVHNGVDFTPRFKPASVLTPITDGFRFTVKRYGGWPTDEYDNNYVTLFSHPIDAVGNQPA